MSSPPLQRYTSRMTRQARVKPGCLLGIIVALLCLLWMGKQGQDRQRRLSQPPPAGQTAPGQPAPTPATQQGPERS